MVLDLVQPMFKCPLCNAPLWCTRLMFWKHIHECLQMPQYNQGVQITAAVNKENFPITNLRNR